MRMSIPHYISLREGVLKAKIDFNALREYQAAFDKADMWVFWNVFWASRWNETTYYREGHYDDKHITTALKKIVEELENITQK